jgi:uncharacterized membrane protein YdjX (TVP38/TMEM64 family)
VRRPVLVITIGALVICAAYALAAFFFSGTPDQGPWLEHVRRVVAGWGRLAPILYTLAVVVEVIVAPFPGTLLYAPAGAIFGGFLGGTLSLVGNVVGAAISCVLGRLIGERLLGRRAGDSDFRRYHDLLRERGLWVVLLLRLNPFTTSDLVSYAAGMAGVRAWKVAVGTLVGLAPWCYLQAYFAEQVFELVPGWILAVSGILLVVGVLLVLTMGRKRSRKTAKA